MSENDPSFPLAGFRPDGSDADDPVMKNALDAIRNDPSLTAAFESQREFDAEVARALATTPVPDDLRETVLAGASLSGPTGRTDRDARPIFLSPWFLGGAAAAAVAVAFSSYSLFPGGRSSSPQLVAPVGEYPAPPLDAAASERWIDTTLGAANEVLRGVAHAGGGVSVTDLVQNLDPASTPLWLEKHLGGAVTLPGDLGKLPAQVCHWIAMSDGEVALLCFDVAGGKTKLHLTVSNSDGSTPASPPRCKTGEASGWEFAAWCDGKRRFILMADASDPVCCQKLREIAAGRQA